MKKLSLLFTLVTLTSLLLSSCSRLENLSVTKRQHRSGYYVDFGSGKDVAKRNDSKTAPKTRVEKTKIADASVEVKSTSNTVSVSSNIAENTNTISSAKELSTQSSTTLVERAEKKKQVAKEKSDNLFASTTNNSDHKEIVISQEVKKRSRSFSKVLDLLKAPSNNEEVPFWALILFAILLPPLAVGLKFGIGTEFWISVLLTLLFWIPGVIYALILILD